MENNKILKEINGKLDLVLSLYYIKEDGKEKTLLEKYNENKTEKELKLINDNLILAYNQNRSHSEYYNRLRKIMIESFEETGMPPKTNLKGYFDYENRVYNIKDYQQ